MTRTVQSRLAFLAVSAFCLAHAATLPYQGLAADAKSNPKTDSSYAVEFALYSASSGGTVLWSESQKVTTRKGLFSTSLGTVTTIPDVLFRVPVYLGVRFDGGAEASRQLLSPPAWATSAGKSATSAFADSTGKVVGLNDSVAALRRALSSQASALTTLSATVTVQKMEIASKDSVGKAHVADSAKVAGNLSDSVRAVRLTIGDSTGSLRRRLADTATALRAKIRVDSQAQAKALSDSVRFVRANVHDTADTLRVRIKGTSLALRASIGDSTGLLQTRLTDSTKALLDTAANLRKAIAGLDATLSAQVGTIASLTKNVDLLQGVLASINDVAWNLNVNYGTLRDSRDGQVYRIVTIGTQTWMAQNLNYSGGSGLIGSCYNGRAESCKKYGRLYDWTEVMDGASSSDLSPSGVKGVCPTEWHLPSKAEWMTLITWLGGEAVAGGTLKSASGWATNTGTDAYGFRSLPGGYGCRPSFSGVGSYGDWWSATSSVDSYVWGVGMGSSDARTNIFVDVKMNSYSVRCVKD